MEQNRKEGKKVGLFKEPLKPLKKFNDVESMHSDAISKASQDEEFIDNLIVSSNRKRLAREIIMDLIKEVVYKIEGKNIVPESPERKRFNKPPKTPL